MQRSLPSLILLAFISVGSLFFRIGSLPLSGADEPRYARIAQEMYQRGDWITPSLEGKPWLEKPPLYYWITIPFHAVFGDSETAARLGPALCAFITALAIFWLGSKLGTKLAGLMGASILLTSLGFAGYARSASTDMPFTCCFSLAMAILAAAIERDIGLKVLVAYFFLGLAILAKGPVALILAIGIGLFYWLLSERRGILHRWHAATGALIIAAVSIPWFWLAFKQNGYAFISTFFINHNLARFVTDIHHHSQPFYFYLPVLVLLIFPWSGWLFMLVSKSAVNELRRWREWNPCMVFLACWFLVPIFFFSFSDSKLAGYILPSFPPLASILGIRISRWIEGFPQPAKLRAGVVLNLLFSVAMAIAAPLYFQKEYGRNWEIGLLLSFAILIPAVFAFGFRANCKRAFQITVLQGLIVLITVAQFAFPVLGAYHSTKEIAQLALQSRRKGESLATYRFFHHSLHYYTDYQITDELSDLGSLQKFSGTHDTALIVTKQDGLREISESSSFSITHLGEQGNFRLFRLYRK
ncbi:MAG: glycosyltransferase family 39 protein [Acidobacteria bacterium]|nr:glycosyltransferase family 39 protein [Acidobacteriota bacterium]